MRKREELGKSGGDIMKTMLKSGLPPGTSEMQNLKCSVCSSLTLTRFIDGFGNSRVFCRKCGNSFLEEGLTFYSQQTNLQEFVQDFL